MSRYGRKKASLAAKVWRFVSGGAGQDTHAVGAADSDALVRRQNTLGTNSAEPLRGELARQFSADRTLNNQSLCTIAGAASRDDVVANMDGYIFVVRMPPTDCHRP